jgi:Fe-S cluster assembly iron-binding protein IscA
MALDETMETDDVEYEVDGVRFVYPKQMGYLMEQVEIDYVRSWFGKRLVVQSAHGGTC